LRDKIKSKSKINNGKNNNNLFQIKKAAEVNFSAFNELSDTAFPESGILFVARQEVWSIKYN